MWLPSGAGWAAFLLKPLEHLPLRAVAVQNMQHSLNRLESRRTIAFPAAHELTILACWMSRIVSNRLFWVYFCYTLSIILLQFIFDTTIRSICSQGSPGGDPDFSFTILLPHSAGKGVNVWEESSRGSGRQGGLKQFVELPYRLYRNERHWCPRYASR